MKTVLVALTVAALATPVSWAQDGDSLAHQPSGHDSLKSVSPKQINAIAGKLMAPCCWSETADVHRSPAAERVKSQIRTALENNYTEQEILEAFVAAYGERILARPKAEGFNLLAWIMPAVAILLGLYAAWRFLRRSQTRVAASPSTPATNQDTYAERLERELEEWDK